ncbi:Ras-related protein Rab-3 [Clonorchis sinensis]|uniref:Ras-related protein Rab-3 n=1 Tax=Clonorchis sinensis TaxID=79923 RepID=G7YFZ7_CLOSI|nr:Ras-related protein Rab-3 [Clonorchis sinensis]
MSQSKDADQNADYMFKILIIGNSSVGKTSFLFRYADDSFTSAFVSTVGIDFKVKTIFRQDKRVKLQIWILKTAKPNNSVQIKENHHHWTFVVLRESVSICLFRQRKTQFASTNLLVFDRLVQNNVREHLGCYGYRAVPR